MMRKLILFVLLLLVSLPAQAQSPSQQVLVSHKTAGGAPPPCTLFPCDALLDDFNRADAANLGSAWTTGTRPAWSNTISLSINKALGDSIASAYWNAGTFANPEVRFCVAGSSFTNMLLWNMGNLNTGSFHGYQLLVSGAAGAVQIYKWTDASTVVQLGSDFPTPINAGDCFGARHQSNGDITVYYCAYGGSCGVSGPNWTAFSTVLNDSTYLSGYIGIKGGDYFENFGGGSH